MAANSYYIYIKSEGAKDNPTKPKDDPGNGETKPKINSVENQEELNFFNIPKFIKKNKMFISVLATVALAKKVLSATEKVSAYIGRETGDYVFTRNVSNALATLNALSNPVGTTISIINQEQEIRLTNQRLSEQRVLLGDSTLIQGLRKV